MNIDFIRHLGAFITLLLAQVLVFNHIHLFGYATPLLFVYILFLFPRDYPRYAVLAWCFAMGIGVDVFSNTPGVAASTLTLMGFVQPYLLTPFLNRDSAEDLTPSAADLGAGNFLAFAALNILLFCLLFFAVETFSFFNWLQWLLNVGGSTLLTLVLTLAIEQLRKG